MGLSERISSDGFFGEDFWTVSGWESLELPFFTFDSPSSIFDRSEEISRVVNGPPMFPSEIERKNNGFKSGAWMVSKYLFASSGNVSFARIGLKCSHISENLGRKFRLSKLLQHRNINETKGGGIWSDSRRGKALKFIIRHGRTVWSFIAGKSLRAPQKARSHDQKMSRDMKLLTVWEKSLKSTMTSTNTSHISPPRKRLGKVSADRPEPSRSHPGTVIKRVIFFIPYP